METVPPGIPTKNTAKCKNLAGQRFGKLVVLSPTEKRMDNGSIVWRCQCDCGNTAEVSARRLVHEERRDPAAAYPTRRRRIMSARYSAGSP